MFITLLGLFLSEQARADCAQPVGRFADIKGQVETQAAESDEWLIANLDSKLCEGSSIRVGTQSRAAISLINDAVLRLDENTTMRLVDINEEEEERSLLDIIKGALHSFSRKPKKLSVNSPYLNGSIEGTEFVFRVTDEQSEVTVFEGTVVAANDQGSVPVTGGESVVALQGQAPTARTLVNPREQVRWGLYYPPVLSAEGSDQLQRAAELLALGRLDQAELLIDEVIDSSSESHLGLALRAVISIALNDLDSAQVYADRATAINPTNPAVAIASSYVKQARLELEQALAVIEAALQEESGNALLWARVGELRLMSGQNSEALAAAKRASELDPSSSQANLVYGFAALSIFDTEQAGASFRAAIELNSSDPMGYLGLGLTKISEGELEAGRHDLEVAVSLDSNNAILRSYLGKAYYEEKRGPLDQQQFEIAKTLDPNDPTPWFYASIAHQMNNRPVQALKEQQKAIELNDNRAVYRSRLLLDSDLASRSASVGRIYSDLGFQELALREGFKSVNTDPSNFSARRLLADSYAVLPRHEISRVSELLQSQLLQPLNVSPIPLSLAESNLPLISVGGPGSVSYNEFNPLFARDGLNLQYTGLVASNDTQAHEVIFSGLENNFAFSLAGLTSETDGFRDNGDRRDDPIASAFVQAEVSPSTSIQAEYRTRETEQGDLGLRFFPENVFDERRSEDNDLYRLGIRHDLAPNSILLASFMYQEGSEQVIDRTDYPFLAFSPELKSFNLSADQDSRSGELQHIYRGSTFNLTSGGGVFDVDGDLDVTATIGEPATPPGVTFDVPIDQVDLETKHKNVYSYANIDLTEGITATLGLSYDDISGDFPGDDTDQTNPKLGLTWEINSTTVLRAAAFKTLKRTLITDQTLEPTQVAGFSQFFDDLNLTEAERYGIGIDKKISSAMFFGAEYSERDLDVPYQDFSAGSAVNRTADWDEKFARLYLFWTPYDQISTSIEYHYEEIDRGPEFPEGVTSSETQRLLLGTNLFWSSGLSTSVRATYYDQEGEYGDIVEPIQSGEDDFWLADFFMTYRMPKRYGLVSVGVSNVFDEEFNYYDQDVSRPSIQPERAVSAKLTLSLQ